jgi:hypothetical protein
MISVPIANDKLTEGDEELTMTIQADGKRFEDKITIDDTSKSSTSQSSTSTSTSTNTTTGTSTTKAPMSVASIVVDGLYKTSTNKFVLGDAGLDVGTVLEDGYVPLMSSPSKGYVPKGVVVAVLSYDNGTTGLLLKSGSTYKEQLFSDVGFVKGSATKLKLPQVLAKEGTLGMDTLGVIAGTAAYVFAWLFLTWAALT